jgi:hypothetical protein
MNFPEDNDPIDFNPPTEERPEGGSFAGSAGEILDIMENNDP